MEIFFNELSVTYPCDSIHNAQLRMSSFIKLLSRTQKEGFNICRIFPDYITISLAPDYSILNWLQDTSVRKVEKQFFLGYVRTPFETVDSNHEDQFILADYFLHETAENKHNESTTEGLAWAYIFNTLSVSFPSNEVWKKIGILLLEVFDQNKKVVSVHHASLDEHIDDLSLWINSLKTIELFLLYLLPDNKQIISA